MKTAKLKIDFYTSQSDTTFMKGCEFKKNNGNYNNEQYAFSIKFVEENPDIFEVTEEPSFEFPEKYVMTNGEEKMTYLSEKHLKEISEKIHLKLMKKLMFIQKMT